MGEMYLNNTFNGFIASIFFAVIGNIMLLFGNEKDEDEFIRRITQYYGMIAILNSIPGLMEAIQTYENIRDDREYKNPNSPITNPLTEFAQSYGEAVTGKGPLGDVSPAVAIPYELMQFLIGVQFTPFESAYQMATSEKYFAYNMWLFFGGAPTAFPKDMRPSRKKTSTSSSKSSPSSNTRSTQIQNQRRNNSRRNKR